jgi:hypothetical protein
MIVRILPMKCILSVGRFIVICSPTFRLKIPDRQNMHYYAGPGRPLQRVSFGKAASPRSSRRRRGVTSPEYPNSQDAAPSNDYEVTKIKYHCGLTSVVRK